jgi:hypothetical protein
MMTTSFYAAIANDNQTNPVFALDTHFPEKIADDAEARYGAGRDVFVPNPLHEADAGMNMANSSAAMLLQEIGLAYDETGNAWPIDTVIAHLTAYLQSESPSIYFWIAANKLLKIASKGKASMASHLVAA